jgi:glycosyltransferase involved in cell wall biosynthesis
MIEFSLCLAVWNTAHLLQRSVYSYLAQDLDPNRWELVVIDDNSPDDVLAVLRPLEKKINLQYVRLEHNYGMRGNTVSFNTAFERARGTVLAETTPECLLPPNALSSMLWPHYQQDRAFVALKTYNLTKEAQLDIDTVDWQKDILYCEDLPDWNSPWTQRNVPVTHFGTHQICSYRKETFYSLNNGRGFPLFGDYGSDDPWFSGQRPNAGITDITLPASCMAVHQWHPPFQYWQSFGLAPHLNRWAHSMSNYLNDTSGHVPEGGTCVIWDKGSHEPIDERERLEWRALDEIVRATRARVP